MASSHLYFWMRGCKFSQARRWIGKNLQYLKQTVPKEWLWILEKVRAVLEYLPPDGNHGLYAMWKQLPGRQSKPDQARLPLEQLRDLFLRLSQDWQRYCVLQTELQVLWTNNPTERAIGGMKMRARMLRGYKSSPGVEADLLQAGTYAR